MNQLVPVEPGPPQPTAPPPRGATVARTLRDIRASLLAPGEAFEKLRDRYPNWSTAAYKRQWPEYDSSVKITLRHVPECERDRQRWLTDSRTWLEMLPESEELAQIGSDLTGVEREAFDRKKARMVVAFMIDAFPNARPHDPVTYTETLVHELGVGGMAPAAIAMACNEIVRKATFLPAISEVLEKAKTFMDSFQVKQRLIGRAMDARFCLEDEIEALEALANVPAEPPPIDWSIVPNPRRFPPEEASRLQSVPARAVDIAEVMAAQTATGGWSQATLAAWGVPWPPPPGWKARLTTKPESKEMSAERAAREANLGRAFAGAQDAARRRAEREGAA